MQTIVVGINHKTAPIEVREKFYLSDMEQDLLLSELKCNPAIIEALALSTCNRTEIYAHVFEDRNYFPYLIRLLAGIKKLPFTSETPKNFYVHADQEAVRHLFCVAAGIDSLILGEKQILGQVRSSVERGRKFAMFAKEFNILADQVLRVGKKARAQTQISYGGSSVSWAAVVKAESLLGPLNDKSVLIIGAGKMGKLTSNQAFTRRTGRLFIMNRTRSVAVDLAKRFKGTVAEFCDIKDVLSQVDVVICSVGAPHYIIETGLVEKAMSARDERPLVLIDISMPRNIDPAVAAVPNVKLFHIDDLEEVVSATMTRRKQAIVQVEAMIDSGVAAYYRKIRKVRQDPEFSTR